RLLTEGLWVRVPPPELQRPAIAGLLCVWAQRSSSLAAAGGPGCAPAQCASSVARARNRGFASARRTARRTPHGVEERRPGRTPTPAQSTRAAVSAMSPPAGEMSTGQPQASARATVPWPPWVITRSHAGIVAAYEVQGTSTVFAGA